MSKEEQLKKLARQLRSILPVARDVPVNFSPEDRRRLRELAGQRVIFKLRNVLTALCGEDARQLMFDRSPELKLLPIIPTLGSLPEIGEGPHPQKTPKSGKVVRK